MKTTITALTASLLLSVVAGCAGEAGGDDAEGSAPAVDIGGPQPTGYTLPGCIDPSGFCVSSILTPASLPPRGAFDANANGIYFVSYRPDTATSVDYYTAVHLDWDGRLVSQSKALGGRPAIKNPALVDGRYFVFGEGTRNVVMDVTGATSAILTAGDPYADFAGMDRNGGVVLGDGRYASTTDYGGYAVGTNPSGGWAYPIECGPTDSYQCQRPATDHTPNANGYLVASSNSITRVRVPSASLPASATSFGYCATPASWTISPTAPLTSASDVPAGGIHAAFRLTNNTLVDCKGNTGTTATLRTVSLPGVARDYEFDSNGGLWIAMTDLAEIAYRSPSGVLTRVDLPAEPTSIKVLPDNSLVVASAGKFYRVRRR